jgi:ABC-2 type transport system permease protein
MISKHLITGELKQHKKGFFIWTGVTLIFTLLVMAFFPSIKEAGDDLTKLLESLPQGLLTGMGMDEMMMTKSLGFYKVYYAVYILVIMGIYLLSIGASIFTKEESKHTIEFLMSKPISRKSVFLSKCTTVLILFIGISLIQGAFAYFSLSFADSDPLDLNSFITMHMHGAALLFLFFALGILGSVFINPMTNFMGIAVGVGFGSYLISALAQGAAEYSWIGYFSPFYYADFDISNPDYSINFLTVGLKIIIGIVLMITAYFRFLKKDFLTL